MLRRGAAGWAWHVSVGSVMDRLGAAGSAGLVRHGRSGAVGTVGHGLAGQARNALVVWRLTEIVTSDEVSRPFREWVTRRWPDSKAAYLVSCPRCVSVWAAAAALLLPEWLCTVLALSSASMLINEVRDHASQRALQRRLASGSVQRASEGSEVQRAS